MCRPRAGEANQLFSLDIALWHSTALAIIYNVVGRQRNLGLHETNDVILYIHSVHKRREYFSTSKLQDEIKIEKFELNKFHASKKDPFY